MMTRRSLQSGLTLVELTVAIVVLGLLSLAVSPMLNSFAASVRGSYISKQDLNNQTIAGVLLEYAAENPGGGSTAPGTLPPPYTGDGYYSTVFNPRDSGTAGQLLSALLTQSGVNPAEVNDDNYPSHRVRVYQLIDDPALELSLPLYLRSGPQVTLRYQFAVLYMTRCERADLGCNPNPVTKLPGSSTKLTPANLRNNGVLWTTVGSDLSPFYLSTLPLQKQMLVTTAQRLDRIRDAMMSYFRAQQNTALASDISNWWLPDPTVTPAATRSGDCWGQWYALNASVNAQLLARAGLSPAEYGVTAWGGPVEFCPDYDAGGEKGLNVRPYYAALRFNARHLSLGLAPDQAIESNNAVLTF